MSCKDCDRYKADTLWCAKLNRKRQPDGSCREFVQADAPTKKTKGISTATLDALVDWMRKRGIVALRHGEIAITLATIEEPMPAMRSPQAKEPETEDERRAREVRERMTTLFGSARTRSD